ncbi:hypothetical protein AMEX_G16867 [Astyanax mexicanus]|uniref:DUF6729 domain-containing protein n=1 Tax=Astyanax mexicanus TaxID=7994 RepID=A0A8T2LIM8_ASTMX|nr:hypothetical protein AMEX_G16867 [Astyanax mexicanus]
MVLSYFCLIKFKSRFLFLLYNLAIGESAKAVPHYQKLCSRDSHIWGITRSDWESTVESTVTVDCTPIRLPIFEYYRPRRVRTNRGSSFGAALIALTDASVRDIGSRTTFLVKTRLTCVCTARAIIFSSTLQLRMAIPTVRIVNPDAPVHRQQAILVATKEARCYRDKKKVFPKPPQELLHETTALAHAEKLLRAEGIPAPSNQMCLGRLVVPFGQYENGSFHWLVANDVGYMKYIIDKHRAEVADPPKKGEVLNRWVKDFLTEYAESFPPVSIVLEANIDRCIYGQRGFEDHTFIEMWELYRQYPTQKDRPEQFTADQRELIKKAYTSVRRWLHTPVTHITSVQMKRFRKFISDKDQQLQAGTSKFDPSSWQGDDMELVAASQRVEDSLKSQKSPSRPENKTKKTREAAVRPKRSETTVQPEQPEPAALPKKPAPQKKCPSQSTEVPSASQAHACPLPSQTAESLAKVELEGWVRLWEKPNGIPPADISWLKEDTERGLFTSVQVYKDNAGLFKRRRVMRSDRMWFYPPEPPGYVRSGVPSPQPFFRNRVFVWRPVGVWRYSLKCPRGDECVGRGQNVYLYKSGYHHRVCMSHLNHILIIALQLNIYYHMFNFFFTNRYDTSVTCPAGTRWSLKSCAVGHVQRQPEVEKAAHSADG